MQNVQVQGCEDRVSEVMRSYDPCEQKDNSSGRIGLLSKCGRKRMGICAKCADAGL